MYPRSHGKLPVPSPFLNLIIWSSCLYTTTNNKSNVNPKSFFTQGYLDFNQQVIRLYNLKIYFIICIWLCFLDTNHLNKESLGNSLIVECSTHSLGTGGRTMATSGGKQNGGRSVNKWSRKPGRVQNDTCHSCLIFTCFHV